ncbi:DUF3054 domain-containing protein [Sinomonas mesophila]|uniref:DUF3054 domain-containing protein n=1 Tax=Sinomonas mesophila TaxID=1531955 RepID=UPI0009848D9E|nr:DUF3054 domain-containing protein [Sinomonas mesophila]
MKSSPSHAAPARALAAAADIAVVLVFAAVGRGFHTVENPVLGVLATAWPFLVGLAAAWAAVRAWRRPLALWPTGIAAWAGAWAIGMLLRAATGAGTAVPFLVVALVTLGLLLLGWRAIALAVRRLSARAARSRS